MIANPKPYPPLILDLLKIKGHFFYFFCALPASKKRFFLINLAEISTLHNKGEQYVCYTLIQLLFTIVPLIFMPKIPGVY
jgi:hypothetical protein